MPFDKVVVVHKFGIISQSHKKKLQERLLFKRQQLQQEANRISRKNEENLNVQITEEFVNEYNQLGVEKRAKHDAFCSQILEKIKKKLLHSSKLDDISMQLAWAELSQLMQCNSPLQEDSMDLFIISLENAQMQSSQIPTLFFLAETVIYWLRTDTMNQPFLRSYEIKLLKIGQLIFQRIYFHFLEGALNDQTELKEHLTVYLHGLDESQDVYSPYPDALLYLRYFIEIGRLITTTATTAPTTTSMAAAAAAVVNTEESVTAMNNSFIQQVRSDEAGTNDFKIETLVQSNTINSSDETRTGATIMPIINGKHETTTTFSVNETTDESFIKKPPVTNENHDNNRDLKQQQQQKNANNHDQQNNKNENKNTAILSTVLLSSINAFVYLAKGNLKEKNAAVIDAALANLIEKSTGFQKDNWINCANSIYVLGECAKMNIKALYSLLFVAQGRLDLNFAKLEETINENGGSLTNRTNTLTQKSTSATSSSGIETWSWELCCIYTDILIDICICSNQSSIRRLALLGLNKDANQALKKKFNSALKCGNSYGLLDMAKFQMLIYDESDLAVDDWSWKVRYFALKGLIRICKILNELDYEEFRRLSWTCLVICQETELDVRVLEAFKVGQINKNLNFEEDMKSKGKIRFKTSKDLNFTNNENIFCQMARRLGEIYLQQHQQSEKITKHLLTDRSTNNTRSRSRAKAAAGTAVVAVKPKSATKSPHAGMESVRMENIPYGSGLRDNTEMSIDLENNDNKYKSSPPPNRDHQAAAEARNILKQFKRTTLKEEIIISEQFQNRIPDYFTRRNLDLMRIVEDQYRKEQKEKFENEIFK